MYLLDINAWLALTFEAHVHHISIRNWFNAAADNSCAFCRITQMGFLRLASNPSVFKSDAVTMSEAWKIYNSIISDSRIRYVEEPPDIEQAWIQYTKKKVYSPKIWTDAYLAAFSQTGFLSLVTFDRGFSQYKNFNCIILE